MCDTMLSVKINYQEVTNMPVSKAQQRATNKYIKANYDRMEITFPKGKKDTVRAHAEAMGESANAFVNRAIDETMERDDAQENAQREGMQP